MKKSIFNIYVPITSQEQADRLKQVCLDNNLRIFSKSIFCFNEQGLVFRASGTNYNSFGLWNKNNETIESTEQEFMELLKQWKDENS